MVNIYDKMKEEGIALPAPPLKGGVYTPVREFGANSLYCSGYSSDLGGSTVIGKLGRDLAMEEEQKAAYGCALNPLANIEAKIGDLNKIKHFVRVLAFVDSADDFVQQPQVVNGASSPLVELFGGGIGCPARSAIGTSALSGGIVYKIKTLLRVEA